MRLVCVHDFGVEVAAMNRAMASIRRDARAAAASPLTGVLCLAVDFNSDAPEKGYTQRSISSEGRLCAHS